MDEKLKPCPFCASLPSEIDEMISCSRDKCPASYKLVTKEVWNFRPLEQALKNALNQFFDAAKYILENEYTHNMNKRKMRAANVAAVSILKNGVKK